MEKVETLVVGGGQAGLAMSESLSQRGIPHVVVEKARIAESWRTARWDSLVANGPAWHDRFEGLAFDDIDPDSFASKDRIARYFEDFAKKISAPVRCGVEVTAVRHAAGGGRFEAETSAGRIIAGNVVMATGAFQRPVRPALVPAECDIVQIHSRDYRNPGQLPDGAVLVVGAGSSGVQIADELLRAGRRVFLSIGPHNRPPRRYRGHDFVWWLGALGHWNARTPRPGMEHVTIAVSGARGGYTIDFRELATRGMTLLGRADAFENGTMYFAADLRENIARGDADHLSVLDTADAFAAREGLDLPEDPEARRMLPDPPCLTHPLLDLDLAASGIASIVWACGYTADYGWVKLDAFDASGRPVHERGVSNVPGLYFLGLPWLSRRASSFIWGVQEDSRHLAAHIAERVTRSGHG